MPQLGPLRSQVGGDVVGNVRRQVARRRAGDGGVSELFEKEKEFCVFLRPDNHIAFISSETSLGNVAEYLRTGHFLKVSES